MAELEAVFGEYYKEHVFEHPKYENSDLDYSLLLAIKLRKEKRAKLFSMTETVFRQVKTFDSVGIGEGSGRDLLRFLWKDQISENCAIALASYVLTPVKVHVQACGGKSVIRALHHDGRVIDLTVNDLSQHSSA